MQGHPLKTAEEQVISCEYIPKQLWIVPDQDNFLVFPVELHWKNLSDNTYI